MSFGATILSFEKEEARTKLRRKRLSACFREPLRFKQGPIALLKAVHMTGFIELRRIIPQMIRDLMSVSSLYITTIRK